MEKKGLKIYSEKNKGSQHFGLSWEKHSGRVFPIKNDRPLTSKEQRASSSFLKNPQMYRFG